MVESTFYDWKHTIKDDKLTGVSCQPIDEVNIAIYSKHFSDNLNHILNFLFCFLAHIRTGSTGSLSNTQLANQGNNDINSIASSSQEEMRCYLEQQHQGHQQLITCMDVVGNTVLTGSQDHTLKVIRIYSERIFDCPMKNDFYFSIREISKMLKCSLFLLSSRNLSLCVFLSGF